PNLSIHQEYYITRLKDSNPSQEYRGQLWYSIYAKCLSLELRTHTDTVVFLSQQRRTAICSVRAQNGIPSIKIGIRDAIPRCKRITRVSRDSLSILITITIDARLRWPWSRYEGCRCRAGTGGGDNRCARSDTHTVPLLSP